MGSKQYWAGRVYDLCVNFLTGTLEGSTESDFMEKPGIKPATPGLQDIGLSPTGRRLLYALRYLFNNLGSALVFLSR